MIEMIFPLEPVPQARPRFTRQGFAFKAPKSRAFERSIGYMAIAAMKGAKPLLGPLKLSLRFYLTKPKNARREMPTVKPDCSNLIKSIEDGCNKIVWNDDAQIISIHAQKLYDLSGAGPRIEMRVDEVAA